MKATLHFAILLTLLLFTGCKDEDDSLRDEAFLLTLRLSNQNQNIDINGRTTFVAGDIFNYTLIETEGEIITQGTAVYNGEELVTDKKIYLRPESTIIVEYPETLSNLSYRATATVSQSMNIATLTFTPYIDPYRVEFLFYGYTPQQLKEKNITIKIDGADITESGKKIGEIHTLFILKKPETKKSNYYNIEINPWDGFFLSGFSFNPGIEEPRTYILGLPRDALIPVWSAFSLQNISGGNYIQICDIDLSAYPNWKPTGKFRGSYDGGGYSIKHLSIHSDTQDPTGLFAANYGILNNIRIKTGSSVKGNMSSGGICGENYGTITGCHNEASIQGSQVGGICGENYGTIAECYNEISLTASGKVGTICGNNSGKIIKCYNKISIAGEGDIGGICGSNSGEIIQCRNEALVTGNGNIGGICGSNLGEKLQYCSNSGDIANRSGYTGGICGYNDTPIYDCYNTGTVAGTSSFTGGISGQSRELIMGCYNTGTITGESDYVGGICGQNIYIHIVGCYNTGIIKGTDRIGGISGNNQAGAIIASYNTGEIIGKGENTGDIYGENTGAKGSIKSCFYTGKVANNTSDFFSQKFSEINWPTKDLVGWGDLAPKNWTNLYYGKWSSPWQDDLGSWNEGINPRYPKLKWEK